MDRPLLYEIWGACGMALDGILFDLDSTILDTSAARVRAWARALERRGYSVAHDRIALEVTRDPDKVVAQILGTHAEARHGDMLRSACAKEYARIALDEGLPIARGAADLLRELHRRGIESALATAATEEEIEIAERASGVAWRSVVDVVISKSDAPLATEPKDVISAALARLGMTPAQCVMLGDSRADARAARHAGVVMVGLTFGGADGRLLVRSGARFVYRDPEELRLHLDHAMRRASPGSLRFQRATLEHLVREALSVAEENLRQCRVPTGAIVARGDGSILSRGRDLSETHGKVAHAELEALRAAAPHLAREEGTLLVSTREPCAMCMAAATEHGIDTVVYARRDLRGGGTKRVVPAFSGRHDLPRVVGGVLAEESERLYRRFAQTEVHRTRGDLTRSPRASARTGSRA
jgi:phosphoglycolate phosphatase-like HAD superfamily hydrolase/tRNA(Arg) A34 adenosine deaminase TadA